MFVSAKQLKYNSATESELLSVGVIFDFKAVIKEGHPVMALSGVPTQVDSLSKNFWQAEFTPEL